MKPNLEPSYETQIQARPPPIPGGGVVLQEGDYARVLQFINEFLPVHEMAGRLVGVPVLRQFGLIESERVDDFLAAAFSKNPGTAEHSLKPRKQRRVRRREKTRARQSTH